MQDKTVLVTGGAGYIGTHTCVELAAAGYRLVVVDNFSNSKPSAIARVEELTGQHIPVHRVDVTDAAGLEQVFAQYPVDAVIHFAGLKAVGESVEQPLRYYRTNVFGTVTLLEVMARAGVKQLVFSSTATVYGEPDTVPIPEQESIKPNSPYGRSKAMVEAMLEDLVIADPEWRVARLRYFNPVGAHVSGRIGEDPCGVPNNLLPYIAQVAVGKRPFLRVWGDDYPTPDGTGVRDYIHVMDLARGHVAALAALRERTSFVVNLGSGVGVSVLDMVQAFARACGQPIPYQMMERRAGDIASYYADPAAAAEMLRWRVQYDVDRMCVDAWRWQSSNPDGYPD